MLQIVSKCYSITSNYKKYNQFDSVFENISGTHFYENYHSDILAYYLKNLLCKKIFINWLNEEAKSTSKNYIQFKDYENGTVDRESDRIDITLLSEDETKAIIIENKSNNAGDQFNQIYRYYKKLKERDISVESIVYINKSSIKWPDLTSVSNNEKEEIKKKLCVTQLVGQKSFCDNVLKQVILSTNDIRLNALSQEIINLFHSVVYGGINMENLDELYDELKKDNNYEKLLNVINAFNDLPAYLADKFKNQLILKYPKNKVWLYKPDVLVIELLIDGEKYAIDIIFHRKEVSIQFFHRNHVENKLEEVKQKYGEEFPFKEKSGTRYCKLCEDIIDEDNIRDTIDSCIKPFI